MAHPVETAGLSVARGVRYEDFRREHLDGVIALCQEEGWPTFPEDPGRALRALTAPGVKCVVAIEDGGNPWSRNNLQAMCSPCHSAKTSREVRAR